MTDVRLGCPKARQRVRVPPLAESQSAKQLAVKLAVKDLPGPPTPGTVPRAFMPATPSARSRRGHRGGLNAERGSDLGGVAGDGLPDQVRGEPAPVDLGEDAVQAEGLGGVEKLAGDLAG